MVRAFIFGKFLPFHKGHEAMIKFALTKCDHLTVLVCCSDKEKIKDITRKAWIENTFEGNENIQIRSYNYLESELPNTSKSSESVSRIWSNIFIKEVPECSVLVTSEEYGKYVANYMGIKHIGFDPERSNVSISATEIRKDIFSTWPYLPDSVKKDLSIKVVVLGTECTGKTTLTERLAKHFNCSFVKEAGRDLIADSKSFEFNDLYLVISEHAKRIEKSIIGKSPLIIIDTDIHITKSYAKFIFDKEIEVESTIYNSNKADLYLYLNNDVAFLQDGTRLSESNRNLLDKSHRQIIHQHNINITEITGHWEQRYEKAVEQINKLIATNRQKHWT